MNDQTHNRAPFDLRRLFGLGRSAQDAQSFDPRSYFKASWRLVRRHFLLVAFELAANLAHTLLWLGSAAVIALALFVGIRGATAASGDKLAALDAFVAHLARPTFVIGAAGLMMCTWLTAICIDAFVSSGIWGTFAQATRGEPTRRWRTFWSHAPRHFAPVLSLRVTSVACEIIVALLGAMVVLGALFLTTGGGPLAHASVFSRALAWAAPLSVLAAFAALVRMTTTLAAAPLLLEARGLGESILQAATLVTRRFIPLYRLMVLAAGLMLVPLFFYWGVLTFQDLTLDVAGIAPLTFMLRMFAEVVLFVATGVVTVLLYGALFLYYGHEMGMIDEPSNDDDNQARHHSTGRAVAPPDLRDPNLRDKSRVAFDEHTTLADLVPDEYPNIIDLDDVLPKESEHHLDETLDEEERGTDGSAEAQDEDETNVDPDAVSGGDIFDSDDDPTT